MGIRLRRIARSTVLLAALSATVLVAPSGADARPTQDAADDPSVAAFAQTWVARALRSQETFDRDEPLINSLVPHSHNSANSSAYAPSLSTLDPNQTHTIGDQLRMGIRGIELDLHWTPSLGGLADGGFAVVLCHGTTVELVDGLPLHVGCSVDRPFRDGLVEINDFLRSPGNEEVVVLLYLENQLDDEPLAHQRAVEALNDVLGDLVQPAPAGTGDGVCAEVPMDQTRQAVLDGGHQVVLVGNCGPGSWGTLVHERGPRWDESSHDGSYPSYPDCIESVRADQDYDANFIRHWEDLTQLTALTNGGATFPITPEVTRQMVACGVDMIGFDKLEPDDGRLEALVWSWAPDEPVDDPARGCAARGADGRFRMDDCASTYRVACRTTDDVWVVPETAVRWAEAEATCRDVGAVFTVPPTGWENERLGVAALGADDAVPVLWLPIGSPAPADVDSSPGPAVPGGAPVAAPPVADGAGAGAVLPVTGGAAMVALAIGAFLVGLIIRPRRAG